MISDLSPKGFIRLAEGFHQYRATNWEPYLILIPNPFNPFPESVDS